MCPSPGRVELEGGAGMTEPIQQATLGDRPHAQDAAGEMGLRPLIVLMVPVPDRCSLG